MDSDFKEEEKLYRAVYPPTQRPNFWKKDGSLSSAALYDPNGLSVDRGYYREDEEVLTGMAASRLNGLAVSLKVSDCKEADAVVEYRPSKANKFHSEIHGSKKALVLSPAQRHRLANCAVTVGKIP